MNIVFIGMSGSGKSTFAKYCAELLGERLIDLDEEIEKKFGSIPSIFANGGEKLFRELELNEAMIAAQSDNSVIATGGGTVTLPDAMKALKKEGFVVYLNCDVKTLAKRLSKSADVRPLLEGEEPMEDTLTKILAEREGLYRKYADIVLNESDVLEARNITDSPLSDQLGALYLELLLKFEKIVYAKIK